MSVFRKLFIAGAIVGAGLGVAVLLGEPASIKQVLVAAEQGWQAARSGGSSATGASTSAWGSNDVQLIPEANVATAAGPPAGRPISTSIEPHLAPIASAASPPAITTHANPPFATASCASDLPAQPYEVPTRARLRSEAPRPIGNEPRSPATIHRTPPTESVDSAASRNERGDQLASGWLAPTLLPAAFATASNAAVATIAEYEAPIESPNRPQISPPPWPAADVGEGPRMHVIVDGDSLERLANRYLGDPRRGREIYEMNREQLSSPDLLPIGAELKIPDRMSQVSRTGTERNDD